MEKYKQEFIPETTLFDAKTEQDLKQAIKVFYKQNIQGQVITNKHTGITIRFTSDGLGKISEARRIGRINAAVVQVLIGLLENAEYSNMGQRKPTDKENVLGYLNFKVKAKIENKLYHFRIAVKLKTNMKAYYNHTVNRYTGWDK
ncbi:MAG: hypothetical protein U5L45_03390 [Saprospiraceae bacterium]|nr:hypothetical protein [Saprospiraceae bacterium]